MIKRLLKVILFFPSLIIGGVCFVVMPIPHYILKGDNFSDIINFWGMILENLAEGKYIDRF